MNNSKQVKVIEIRGVGFVNKGAELMLQAIKHKIKDLDPNIRLVMEVDYGKGLTQAKELAMRLEQEGLFIKPVGRWRRLNIPFLFSLIPQGIRGRRRFVLESEIDVVLDGSGFAFGDSWGANFAKKRLTNSIEKWSQQGKKIILLPQAFGPFENSDVLTEVQKIGKYADLLIARDSSSYQHLTKALPNNEKILQYPDFTNILECKPPHDFDPHKLQVAFIPNFKMGNVKGGIEGYKKLLAKAIELTQSMGFSPFFLIHEGIKDELIANEVTKALKKPIPIVKNKNAIEIKGIIGSCYAVITSRFHGLVSALSQGVPCLATTWSHKYMRLMEDYQYSEGLIADMEIDVETLEAKMKSITDPESNQSVRKHLLEKSKIQKQLSVNMWKEVIFQLTTPSQKL